MAIKFVDLSRQYRAHENELLQAIIEVLERGDFILGKAIKEFEESFSNFIECQYAVGVDSGSSALSLALKALEIGQGDEVITVPNTFISTVYAISECGATPVFIDVDEQTQLMDILKVEPAITSKTKAIIPVHLFGQMVDMEPLLNLAQIYQLRVVEDAAQAHGSMQNGKKGGSFGDMGCFSFYPGKNLGAYGDAGIITTNDNGIYEKLLKWRNYGSNNKYYHEFKGRNARLDTIQAAILNVKLKYLDEWNKKRNEIAQRYMAALKGVGDLILPHIKSYNYSVFHLFVVRTKKRDALFEFLNSKSIQTIIHYPVPVHLQKAYAELQFRKGTFPITELLADEIISLPIHPELTEDDFEYIADAVKDFFS